MCVHACVYVCVVCQGARGGYHITLGILVITFPLPPARLSWGKQEKSSEMPFGLVWAWLASVSHHPPLDRRYTLSPHPPTPPSTTLSSSQPPPPWTCSAYPLLHWRLHWRILTHTHTWHSDTIYTQALAHKCKYTVHICTFKWMTHSNPDRDGWVSFECQSESGGRPADLTGNRESCCVNLSCATFTFLPFCGYPQNY